MPEITTPEPYILWLTGGGALIALVAWLPLVLRRLPLSLPIVCIAIGAAVFALPQVGFLPLPAEWPAVTERLTEFIVIIALMGAGLKLDRPFGWRKWGVTWRLLAITMPLSIAGIAAIGLWGLGLSLVGAILLGACLAPTDPVLAADVQVGPPRSGQEDEVRFGLTSEAGLNDGLAFPFVNLALALAAAAATGEAWFADWALHSVAWEIGVGVAVGWLAGRGIGWLTFSVPADSRLARTGDGLIAIAATLVAYGVAEMLNGYGFLSVFLCGLLLRRSHSNHEFNHQLHALTEQFERLSMMVLLILFGGALVSGLLVPLGWGDVMAAAAVILVVRPLAGLVGMAGFPAHWGEKLTLSFFGIRGVGSFYYLAYALNTQDLPEGDRLWGLTGLIALFSILLHGLTVTPAMRALDRQQDRDPDGSGPTAEPEEGPADTDGGDAAEGSEAATV